MLNALKIDPEKLFQSCGLTIRSAQLEMIEHIKKSIQNNRHLVIEAGTGIGKTFAYLIGALNGINQSQPSKSIKTIVISTNTIALQEQLINKDIPFIIDALNQNITYTLAKGRNRYICHHKFFNYNESNRQYDMIEKQLNDHHWSGDLDELSFAVDQSFWQKINNTKQTCIGTSCEFYHQCAFLSAREHLKKSDIIVINHNLLLSHLSLGDEAILPKYDDCVYIIDECHQLPEKALSTFTHHTSLVGAQKWIQDIDNTIKTVPVDICSEQDKSQLNETRKALIEQLRCAVTFVDEIYQYYGRNHAVYRIKRLSEAFQENAQQITHYANKCLKTLNTIKHGIEKQIQDQEPTTETLQNQLTSIKFYIDRSQVLTKVWEIFAKDTDDPPVAKWFALKQQENNDREQSDYAACVCPVTANYLLQQYFWNVISNNVILCSATLKSLNEFDTYLYEAGLDKQTVDCVTLPSPFEYNKSKLFVPNMKYSPQNQQHILESSQIITKVIEVQSNTGILVLFCSRTALFETFENLPKKTQSLILLQGDKPKSEIIKSHRQMVDYGQKSIIFGLNTFAEGIDLQGDYLKTLIIHKIPFSVPDHPVEQTRHQWLTAQGHNPFADHILPLASLKLTQMVGRLIRSEKDTGQLVILDNRIIKSSYGKSLLDNLPDFEHFLGVDPVYTPD